MEEKRLTAPLCRHMSTKASTANPEPYPYEARGADVSPIGLLHVMDLHDYHCVVGSRVGAGRRLIDRCIPWPGMESILNRRFVFSVDFPLKTRTRQPAVARRHASSEKRSALR